MAITIACISGKGGVGKTTTILNLAAALAETGQRVLVVDCDPQSNLTSGLGLDPYTVAKSLGDVLAGRLETPADAVVGTAWANLSILPGTPDLTVVESELPTSLNRELRLRDAMTGHGTAERFDFILYDTPPSFGFHTVNVLAAVHHVLIPVQMSGYAIRGLKEVLRSVRVARTRLNPDLEILGIVPTFVNLRTKFSRQMLEGLCDLAGIRVFDTVMTPAVRMQETSLAGVPITSYAPNSASAMAYRRLAAEVLTHV